MRNIDYIFDFNKMTKKEKNSPTARSILYLFCHFFKIKYII